MTNYSVSVVVFWKEESLTSFWQQISMENWVDIVMLYKIKKMGSSPTRNHNLTQSEYISQQQFSQVIQETSFINGLYNPIHSMNSICKNTRYLRKIIPFYQSSQNIIDYLQKLNSIGKLINCQNLLIPITWTIKGQQVLCNDHRSLQIVLDNYDIKMYQEIIARKHQKDHFAEEEVWYILYSIINAVRSFQKVHCPSGYLKTQHILLNRKGHIKVINFLSYPEAFVQGKSENFTHLKTFYSPEQLKILREGIGKRPNPHICQTFSVAIIILQICSFINGDRFYDTNLHKINDLTIKRALEIINQRYSKLLSNLIKTMLSTQDNRPLPSQIHTIFKPYQTKILNLHHFKFQSTSTTKDSFSKTNASYQSY